jgi:hypothetical protein
VGGGVLVALGVPICIAVGEAVAVGVMVGVAVPVTTVESPQSYTRSPAAS